VAFTWRDDGDSRLLVVVNYAAHASQCWLLLPLPGIQAGQWRLTDLMGNAVYDREGRELSERGLYLDLGPWQYHVFELISS
jgi:hypothetical protein